MRGSHPAAIPIFLALSLLAATGGAVEYAGGTGEPNDPYLIVTAEQFLEADFETPGVYYRLCRNIDLGRRRPVSAYVRAHLDGTGCEVRNAAAAQAGGIFVSVGPEGTITNLTLASFDIGLAVRPDQPEGGNSFVGGLAAGNAGTISNCHATGWISTSRIAGAGGLVGGNSGSIINCSFDGWVSASWEIRTFEDEFVTPCVGGLVAYNFDSGLIANSFSSGFVLGTSGCGGLVGINGGTVRNCYSTCTVMGNVGSGGLVAYNWGALRTCYARGLVLGQLRGGLVGMAGQYEWTARVTNCLWDTEYTDCSRSGGGISSRAGWLDWMDLALNGWTCDPNWVMGTDRHDRNSYPRLAWEGAAGQMVGEYPLPLFMRGSGTRQDPYVIRTREDLYFLSRASIYWDKHFILANDLNVGAVWAYAPIGVCAGSSFSGTFDGKGHVIRNMIVNVTSDEEGCTAWNFGLFGYVTGEVRSLVLENCRLWSGMNACRVGLLAGTSEGTILNCSATGVITVGEKSRFIGGLIGLDNGQIGDCDATVTIEAGEGSTDIGPLVGSNESPWLIERK